MSKKQGIISMRVEHLLKQWPELRGDDWRLIANMWSEDLIKLTGVDNLDGVATTTSLALIASKQVTSPESIRRCRQKIQQMNANLRDPEWEKRQNHIG